MFHWLISEIWLEKHLESGSGRELAIVIIIENSTKAFNFVLKGWNLKEC